MNSLEEFFFHSHPFSDCILLVQNKEFHVDRSVLASTSKVFQTHFQDENIDSIEILDVTTNEMLEFLQFFYPQFQCTINDQNVTSLVILAHRFEIDFLACACRRFVSIYLSKFKIENDATRLSILEMLCIWFREYFFVNDLNICQFILKHLSQCRLSQMNLSDLEDNIQWLILQSRAKYLEMLHV